MVGGTDRRWPFAAREREVAAIVADGGRGAVIVGEPGVGKTRLLGELVERLVPAPERVVHVGATRSLSSVPFGAFAGALAIGFDGGAPFEALTRALDALASGPLEELVLAVDDAHLLDEASAGLVLLAARAGARVVATARSREPSPDAITRLWKDDYVPRVDLQPLDEDQLGTLLQSALGGPLDSRSRYRLYDVTRGNLLFARELVRHGRATGSLIERDGVWSWTASTLDAASVHQLVRDRLAAVPPDVTTLVELLAIGEPFGPAVVSHLGALGALALAEDDGLVVWQTSGLRRELRLVHPLYAEVVRDTMGPARRAARSRDVAAALAATGARRRDDQLRVVVLQLDAGAPCDPHALRVAVREAGSRADLPLAERLARAAFDADGSAESALLLGNVLYWQGRHDELIALLGDPPSDASPADVAGADLLVASSLFWGLDRFDDADARIQLGIERAGYPLGLELVGQRAQMLMFAGRALESIAIGRSVLDDEHANDVARSRAYAGVLPSAACCGRLDEVTAELPIAMQLALSVGGDLAHYASGGVMVAAFITQLFAGGLEQVDVLVGALHDEAVRRIDDPFRGVWSFMLGRSALARGDLDEATTRLRDSTALLRAVDPGAMLPWSLAALAQACGVTGDAPGAQSAMRQLDEARRDGIHNIDVDVDLGRAWAAWARGERTQAQSFAEKSGRSLLDDGRTALGAYALHDAMRLGVDPARVLADLTDAAAACDGVVVETFAHHASALANRDFDGLLAASAAFESAGWRLHAAECCAGASTIAAAGGLAARQREAAIRAAELRRGLGRAITPMLEAISGRTAITTLTKREHEVAMMAARGTSKREIADTLFLSVRTVGNHINHVYGKLGITSREELRAIFELDA
ncbi:MAG TPA: LuxR C-terminal-related transcriptional regulator [Acidimicrobiia bacterium]|nr:LuxR C-terminal-related transcriptional regulator [Acidimicrobiia bacterium]